MQRTPDKSEIGKRPSEICAALLRALDAAEGRRRMRKRDQTPDSIGLEVKRRLLERAVADDPDPHCFEDWLLSYAHDADSAPFPGAVATTARTVLEEWRLAHSSENFSVWLELGAPSDDASNVRRR